MTQPPSDPAKEFLLTAIEAKTEASRFERKVHWLEARTERVTASLTGMPRSGNADAERAWAALADARTAYTDRLIVAIQQEQEVANFIDLLPSRESRMILRLRYVDALRWPRILEQMETTGLNYSERQMYRLHGRALNEAREMWKELYN